ncbi:ABC transporter permease [Leeia oryzae]|uniref:ABC transporter permease n=1 Tax=Leeia oryzae TaxID=356662 RepID=UPI00037EFD57|nr:FtsX-like permease family protein [Leeia oryzae]
MFGWYLFWRDIRQNWMMLVALIIAISALSTVQLASSRLTGVVESQGAVLLAGDALYSADHPVPTALIDDARRYGLQTARAYSFPSMAQTPKDALLVSVKAVESAYPLRGRLTVALPAGTQANTVAPAAGRVWVDQSVLDRLGLSIGSPVSVGDATLKIAGVLLKEPDARFSFNGLAPRLMMSASDLPKTGLMQAQSRINYSMMVAGDPQPLSQWLSATRKALKPGERLEDGASSRSDIKPLLDRAVRFLGMAGVLSVVLALSATLLLANNYIARHLKVWALLRVQGRTTRQLMTLYIGQFLGLGALATCIGLVIGWVAQSFLVAQLNGLLTMDLPSIPWRVVAVTCGMGLSLILVVALPALWQMRGYPATVLLRSEIPVRGHISGLLLGGVLLSLVSYWILASVWVAGLLLGGLLAWCLVIGLVTWLVTLAIYRWLPDGAIAIRLAMTPFLRQPFVTGLQVGAISLGLFAMLLIGLTATRLMQSWEGKIPDRAPNRFVLNLQQDQLRAFDLAFRHAKLEAPVVYPMIRGRLMWINQLPVREKNYADLQTRRLATREFNLSWMQAAPIGNQVIAGKAFDADTRQAWSVEQGLAERLNIHVGDRLQFDIAGDTVSGTVTNLRKLDWTSFQVNFFVIGSPDLMQQISSSYISSFYLSPAHRSLATMLVKTMPNLTIIDVTQLLDQVRGVIAQLTGAVRFVLSFSLMSGVLVLWAALTADMQNRKQKIATLKALGFHRHLLWRVSLWEFLLLGALAGFFAFAMNELFAYVVSTRWLELPYQFDWKDWVITPSLSALLVVLCVLPVLAWLQQLPPVKALRG